MKYLLSDKQFKTKSEIKLFFKKYKDDNEVGTILQGLEHSVMFDLIKWHPSYNEWGYGGLNESKLIFKIAKDIKYKKQTTFSVTDVNRTWAFSYLKCIRAGTKETNKKHNVLRAARESINYQIHDFKDKCKINNLYECSIDKNFYSKKDIHVDHNFEVITFQRLIENFLKYKTLTYCNAPLTRDKYDHSCFPLEFKKEWLVFHKEYAVLRCIHKKYNLRGSRFNVFLSEDKIN